MLVSSATATQAAAPNHSARFHASHSLGFGAEVKRAMMRFSNAYGTWLWGGFRRATAKSFFCSSDRFINSHFGRRRARAAGYRYLALRSEERRVGKGGCVCE